MQFISLLFLIGAIMFGIVKKVNVGIVSLGLSLLLALLGKVPMNTVIAGFPTKLFVTLLGTMFLFSLLQENKTLEIFSKKIIKLVGKRIFSIPIIIYVVSYLLSAAGPGSIPVLPISIILAVGLAIQMDISPLMMGILAALGAVGGTLSPIALTGILVQELLMSLKVPGMQAQLFVGGSIVNFVCAVMIYLYFKGYKLSANAQISIDELPPFNSKQKISLVGLFAMIICVIGFNLDVGLVSFTVALMLIIFKTANESNAIKLIPWSVLILVCGVNVLMNITQQLGGIKLLANILASVMNEITAAPIIGFTAGFMAQFSSANGVVMPTLIPTVPEIVGEIGGNTNIHEMVQAIVTCSVLTMSPLSTAGALIMASYTQGKQVDESEQNALFARLFIISFVLLGIVVVATLLGVFKLFI